MDNKIPKLVRIRINRAEGLRLNINASKKKKTTSTWRVVCSSGSKKQVTPAVEERNGNPLFNCDVHLKISRKHIDQPIVLLVMDSLENHVGQAYLLPANIPPLPRQSSGDPVSQDALETLAFSQQFVRREELEPTKKNSAPEGYLYFWCYVEEYREITTKKGNITASLLNLHESSSLSKSASSLISRSKLDLKSILPGKKKKKESALAPPSTVVLTSKTDLETPSHAYNLELGGSVSRPASENGPNFSSFNPSRFNPSADQISISGSELSVVYHGDTREQADGRGDSEASSIATEHGHVGASGAVFSPAFQIPPLSVIESQKPPPSTPATVETTASSSKAGSIVDVHAATQIRLAVPNFFVEPSEGPVNASITVHLRGPAHLVPWIRECVVAIRFHNQKLALSECLEIPSEAEKDGGWVRIHLPAQKQPLSSFLELETLREGLIPSENRFSYVSPISYNTVKEVMPSSAPVVTTKPAAVAPLPLTKPTSSNFTPATVVVPPSSAPVVTTKPAAVAPLPLTKPTSSNFTPATVVVPPSSAPVVTTKPTSSNITASTTTIAKATTSDQPMGPSNDKPSTGHYHQRYQSDGQWSILSADIFTDSSKKIQKKTRSLTKKDLLERNGILEKENLELQSRLHNQEQMVKRLYDENITLNSRLSGRDRELESLRQSLCALRIRLLVDGLTDYLEINHL